MRLSGLDAKASAGPGTLGRGVATGSAATGPATSAGRSQSRRLIQPSCSTRPQHLRAGRAQAMAPVRIHRLFGVVQGGAPVVGRSEHAGFEESDKHPREILGLLTGALARPASDRVRASAVSSPRGLGHWSCDEQRPVAPRDSSGEAVFDGWRSADEALPVGRRRGCSDVADTAQIAVAGTADLAGSTDGADSDAMSTGLIGRDAIRREQARMQTCSAVSSVRRRRRSAPDIQIMSARNVGVTPVTQAMSTLLHATEGIDRHRLPNGGSGRSGRRGPGWPLTG
jgi:hypothetical protein